MASPRFVGFFVLHAVRISGVDDFLFAGLLELRHIERLTRLQIRKVRDARRRGLGFELAFAPRHDWRRCRPTPPVSAGGRPHADQGALRGAAPRPPTTRRPTILVQKLQVAVGPRLFERRLGAATTSSCAGSTRRQARRARQRRRSSRTRRRSTSASRRHAASASRRWGRRLGSRAARPRRLVQRRADVRSSFLARARAHPPISRRTTSSPLAIGARIFHEGTASTYSCSTSWWRERVRGRALPALVHGFDVLDSLRDRARRARCPRDRRRQARITTDTSAR